MSIVETPEWIKRIERAAGGKGVLLVEGDTDIRMLAYFLESISPDWNARFGLFSANSKQNVLKAIKTYHPEWGGVIDQDEWSPTSVQRLRVKVLPRFCLENYVCVPEELWEALPQPQKTVLTHGLEDVRQPLIQALPDWLAHGAMWRVIRRRHARLVYESDFPSEFDSRPITDEQEIRSILEAWHRQLDPEQILDEYRGELAAAKTKIEFEQLTQYVHGKKFFQQVVVPTLNSLFGQANSDKWSERLTQSPAGLRIPHDLSLFLQDVLRLF